MKQVLLCSVICFFAFPLVGQQDPLYSQYILNPFVLNPAYAGITNNLNTSLSFRQQWAGLEGSPRTINFNSHMSLVHNTVGAGLIFVSDKIGNRTINEVMTGGSYRITISKGKTLMMGLQAGVTNYQIDNSGILLYDISDPLFQGKVSESRPTLGAGIILKDEKFLIGFSVPRILASTFEMGGLQTSLYSRHYYLMGSYSFFLSKDIRFKPSTLFKVVESAPLSADLNASLIIRKNYQAGLLTRNFNTYGAFLQMSIKDSLVIGYVFEVPSGNSVSTNFSTHEIMLGYRINVLSFHNGAGL